jgi:hypothetical protein
VASHLRLDLPAPNLFTTHFDGSRLIRMIHPPLRRLAFGFILSTSWLAVFSANASPVTWDGGGSTTAWELPANWSSDSVPSSSDQVSIGGADVDFGSAQTIDSFASLAGGVLTKPAAQLELTGGVGAASGQWKDWQSLEIGGHDYGVDPATHTGNPIGYRASGVPGLLSK